MNKLNFLLITTLLINLSTPLVQAQNTSEEQVEIVSMPKKQYIYEDSSEYNRIDKKYNFGVEILGINSLGLLGTGAQVGYFIDRNSLVMLDVTSSSLNTSYWNEYLYTGYTAGAHYKHFYGNSFYFRAGIDQRNIEMKVKSRYILTDDYINRNFEVESTAASIVIGNQWQWSNFTLGCDWYGLSVPLRSSVKSEYLSANADDYDRKRIKEDEDQFSKNSRTQGLRFYLGASFK